MSEDKLKLDLQRPHMRRCAYCGKVRPHYLKDCRGWFVTSEEPHYLICPECMTESPGGRLQDLQSARS